MTARDDTRDNTWDEIQKGIRAGQQVPPLERRIELPDMIAYAGATWDWHRLHYDPEFAKAARLPGPIVDGQVFGALLVEQIQDWLGPRCFVRELEFTFKALVFAGETIRCEGTVTEVGDGVVELDLRVVVVGEDRGTDRVAVAPARARVLLGTVDGPGATGKQGASGKQGADGEQGASGEHGAAGGSGAAGSREGAAPREGAT